MAPRKSGRSSTAKILPFPSRPSRKDERRVLRLSPEYSGTCLLYAHHVLSRDKLFAIKILCWARLANGDTVALVPWLNGVSRCIDLDNPDSGQAMGYYDPHSEARFDQPPIQHVAALDALSEVLPASSKGTAGAVVQEIPDNIGSHAALLIEQQQEFALEPVVSWRLDELGNMDAMVADMDRATQTPVLSRDDCLYPVREHPGFRYFFQYHIANQIKAGGVMAARAISQLIKT